MNIRKLYKSLDLDEVDRLISIKQEENLYLDFKQVEKPSFTRNDRKTFAKCVSGFANSSGGLVIWGIDARPDESGIDCASEKVPIRELALFLSTLSGLTGDSVDPIAEGIVHKKILDEEDSGYAVTLIPESLSGPHMAKLGEDRYYKRSGDSFYKMEHYDIEDMFGRRKRPNLSLTTKLRGKGPRTWIIIGIKNEGRGTARAPYVAFDSPGPFSISPWGYDGNRNEGLPRLSSGTDQLVNRYGANADFVIHPGTSIDITSLFMGLPSTKRQEPPKQVTITYEVAADDQRLTRSKIIVDLRDANEDSSA